MRRFEFVEGSSSKFWEIEMNGTEFTTRWGKIGTPGSSGTKSWDSEEKCKKEYDKRQTLREKQDRRESDRAIAAAKRKQRGQ